MAISKHKEKLCHLCGEMIGPYVVKDNACYHKECFKKRFPGEDLPTNKKPIPNQATMIKKLKEGEKSQKKL